MLAILYHPSNCWDLANRSVELLPIKPSITQDLEISFSLEAAHANLKVKDIYSCPIEIIKGLTDKGQFQYLTKLKGPQEGTSLYTTQFLSLR